MNAFYCPVCDKVIVHENKATDPRPVTHITPEGDEHWLKFMQWFHPDYKVCEVEGTIRHQIETLGLAQVA